METCGGLHLLLWKKPPQDFFYIFYHLYVPIIDTLRGAAAEDSDISMVVRSVDFTDGLPKWFRFFSLSYETYNVFSLQDSG